MENETQVRTETMKEFESRQQYLLRYCREHGVVLALSLVFSLFIAGLMWWTNGVSTLDEIILPIFSAVTIFLCFCVLIFRNYHPDEIFMQQIGNRLGYNLEPTSPKSIESLALFRKSRFLSTYYSGVLLGLYNEHSVRLFYYTQGTPRSGGQEFTVLEYTLPDDAHTLLLLSKLSQFNYYANPSTLTPIPERITLNLGEEFAQHFTLHTSKQFESEVLNLFTPDVIKNIIANESFRELGLEISGKHLFVFRYRKILDEQRMLDFHRAGMALIEMLSSRVSHK